MNERERLIKLLQSVPADYEGNRGVGTIADYLLANGVIVPPCKIGDTVYQQDGVRIYESVIEEITIDIAAGRPNKMIFYTNKITFDQTAVGRIIFLTREEAEAARIAAQLSNVL